MKIGEKIKKLRTDKDFSQENIYPNQSLVSQIEKGVNNKPTEQTLRIIADRLDIPFEELIEGTDWQQTPHLQTKGEYAISHTECIVTIEDSGEIKTRMKSYPHYNSYGEENKFDPDTGYKLLIECKHCKSAIQKPNQVYCLGCGEKLVQELDLMLFFNQKHYDYNDEEVLVDEFWTPHDTEYTINWVETHYTDSLPVNEKYIRMFTRRLGDCLSVKRIIQDHDNSLRPLDYRFLSQLIRTGFELSLFEPFLFVDPKGNKFNVRGESENLDENEYEGTIQMLDFFNIKPNKINNDCLEQWWIWQKYGISLFKGLLNELLRHQERLTLNKKKAGKNDKILSETKQKKAKDS